MTLLCKKCVATFWAILVKIRQLFIPSSGHTGIILKFSAIVHKLDD